jgi:hypothetical protein
LKEENAALRKEIMRLAARIHECLRCNGRAIDSGHPPREGNQEGARLDALEKKMNELGPSIMRVIEKRFGGRRPRSPEPRRKADQRGTTTTAVIKERGEGADRLRVWPSPSDSHDGPGNAALGGVPPSLPNLTRMPPTTTKGDDDEGVSRKYIE